MLVVKHGVSPAMRSLSLSDPERADQIPGLGMAVLAQISCPAVFLNAVFF
jgi:hypothetical protein